MSISWKYDITFRCFDIQSRTPHSITISEFGQEATYELLNILDFNNVRKRMSVILRKDGKLRLYCKGADTTVLDRINTERNAKLLECTHSHLNVRKHGNAKICFNMKLF